MLGPVATRAAACPFSRCRYRYCLAPPAHRCPRRRQQQQRRRRVTEGTAMVPWNGPNELRLCNFRRVHYMTGADLTSKRSSSAMNMPGMTMSPRPSMAKLLAASPFSSKSCGNTTTAAHSWFCFNTFVTDLGQKF